MKRSDLAHQIKEMIVDVLSEVTVVDKMTTPDEISQIAKDEKKDPNTVKQALATAKQTGKPVSIAEEDEFDMEDEKEPSAKDIKKGDSVSTIARKLQDNTKEMKSTVNKWKQAEGEEKERLLARLKELTKIKKELEGLV
jgi:glutamyl/glutaminyl-tRNA synthetase